MRDIKYVKVTVPAKLIKKVHRLPRLINRSEFLRVVFRQPANVSVKLEPCGKRRDGDSKSKRWARKLEANIDWVLERSKVIVSELKYRPL